jgi:hypothetical protein
VTGYVPPKPVYLADPVADALTHVVCELTAELWSVKRRLRLLEAELEARGGAALDEVPVSDEEARASALAAREFVTSVLGAFQSVPGEGALPRASG